MDLLTPSSSGGLPTASLTTKGSWLSCGRLPRLSSAFWRQYRTKKIKLNKTFPHNLEPEAKPHDRGSYSDSQCIADAPRYAEAPVSSSCLSRRFNIDLAITSAVWRWYPPLVTITIGILLPRTMVNTISSRLIIPYHSYRSQWLSVQSIPLPRPPCCKFVIIKTDGI